MEKNTCFHSLYEGKLGNFETKLSINIMLKIKFVKIILVINNVNYY